MFRFTRKKKAKQNIINRVLVFPKGTLVKYGGIPCELLQDTPYESEHYRQASAKDSDD